MKPRPTQHRDGALRQWQRFPHLRELTLTYEGHSEDIVVRPPDISPHGMFINTPNHFPEGAVLKVRFRLTRSNVEVNTRCEVRYCLPGVGIGVEFLNIPPEAAEAIEKEVRLTHRPSTRKR
jgi:hypothetical protein